MPSAALRIVESVDSRVNCRAGADVDDQEWRLTRSGRAEELPQQSAPRPLPPLVLSGAGGRCTFVTGHLYPVERGLVVRTRTEKVDKIRRLIIKGAKLAALIARPETSHKAP